ncbi:DNA uptake protein ComE-like DNA-binding protein [Mucilaginibacter yixingensis]|uniref:DNA uptake protein ComE-like DNA-binding protein n=1 Tax=Mucilaginibacter yixingensis TaxID=1295612 RepID=A0A2T5J8D1_9SPHI|nr:helix-hairpin-helix domain-containing protein [Mucilaginibacter yixingensis]PTQ95715.1 DNA uptake protein ComE-like DNA-binding protein [Mucilaginibacter yixingensis]
MKSLIKDYLTVTKKEWNGLVVLILLIIAVWMAPVVYQRVHKDKLINLNGFDATAARLHMQPTDTAATIAVKMFRFNPNHLPATDWQKLGLNDHQITTIQHYEAKGGRFYTKADLKKIYAITAIDYKRLEPYINLPEKDDYTEKSFTIVELNSADSTRMTTIRGIGPGYAVRIIRYRDRLGGFYKKEQLKEIFGIDSLMYHDLAPQVSVDAARISKINLNIVTLNNLLVFPYLSYKQKNAIVEYRNQHGNYAALDDLKNIPIIDDGILSKIAPYITFK